MVKLHLVRHAPSLIDPALPSWEWELAPSATAAVARLRQARVLPMEAFWKSSSEPKAMRTAGLLTDAFVRPDDRLREAIRDPAFLELTEFQARVLDSFALLDEPAASGWEPLRTTRARVLEATEHALAEAAGLDVVLTGHGTAHTMLVSALTGNPPDVAAWETMRMPDHCCVDVAVGEIASPWGAW